MSEITKKPLKYDSSSDDDEAKTEVTEPGDKLLQAILNDDRKTMETLLTEDPSLIHFQDSDGYTALHRASYSENAEFVRFLIGKGANVNAVSKDGRTPLHSACHWNAYKCVRALIENGADVNAQTNGGQTPLHTASNKTNGTRETIIILLTCPEINVSLKNSNGETAEDLAIRAGKHNLLFQMHRKSLLEFRST